MPRRISLALAFTITTAASAQPCQPQVTSVGGPDPIGAFSRVDSMITHNRSGTPTLYALLPSLPTTYFNPPLPEPPSYIETWNHGWKWAGWSFELFNRKTTLLSYTSPAGSPEISRVYAVGFPPLVPNTYQSARLSWLDDSSEVWNRSDFDLGRNTQTDNTLLAMAAIPYPSTYSLIVGGDFRNDWYYRDLLLACATGCGDVSDPLATTEVSNVRALAFYARPPSTQLELYAGGKDILQAQNRLAHWDGFAWQPAVFATNESWDLTGLNTHADALWITTQYTVYRYDRTGAHPLPSLPNIQCLAWFDDGSGEHLYAGGSFALAPNTPPNQVAMFDGTAWQPVGEPFLDSEVDPLVKSLVVHDFGQGPRLVASGSFHRVGSRLLDNIAVWDHVSWRPLGNTSIFRSGTYLNEGAGSDFYAVIWSFRYTDRPHPDRVVRLHNGEVQLFGDDFPMGSEIEHIYAFDLGSGPALYVVGDFAQLPGGAPAQGIARWDGSAWRAVGNAMPGQSGRVREALLWDEDGDGPQPPALFATGDFTSLGGVPARNVARWDGTSWSPLDEGLSDPGAYMTVRHTQALNELLIATSHTDAVGELAIWNGHWTTTPAPTPQPYLYGSMMAVYDSGAGPDIYLNTNLSLQRFDGSSWAALTTPLNYIFAIATFDDGTGVKLYLSGFDATSHDPTVYRWNGASFEEVPGPAYAQDFVPSFDGSTRGMITTNGPYAIGASFIRPCPACGSADFDCDGDIGTDADIESFFACLSGHCPGAPCASQADFNHDGDTGTDADIESFFRVLAGGPC